MAKKKKKKQAAPADSTEVTKLKEKVARQAAEIKESKLPKQGIKNVKKTIIGEQPRPDKLIAEHLESAEGKTVDEMTEAEKLSVERTIRRYVKKGGTRRDYKGDFYEIPGGFRKGLSEERIAYAKILLNRMGRDPENPTWDESIQVPGFSDTLKGQSANL